MSPRLRAGLWPLYAAWLGTLALAVRLALLVPWPLAWLASIALGRAPRWWAALARRACVLSARARPFTAQGLAGPPPPPVPAPRLSRLRLLGRPLSALAWFAVRYGAGAVSLGYATVAWACLTAAGRRPAGIARGQATIEGFVAQVDAHQLLLSPSAPRLPEPDPRLRPRAEPSADHAPLPPYTRRMGWIALVLGALCLAVVSLAYGVGETVFEQIEDSAAVRFTSSAAIQLALLAAAMIAVRRAGGLRAIDIGLSRLEPLRSSGAALRTALVYALLISAYGLLVGLFLLQVDGEYREVRPGEDALIWTIAIVATGTVMAPVFEEVLYRGVAFQALRRGRGTWVAAVLTSVVFALNHFDLDPFALASRTALGLAACWVFVATGRLLAAMMLHSLNNSLVIGLSEAELGLGVLWLVPLSLAFVWLAALVLRRFLSRRASPAEGVGAGDRIRLEDPASIAASLPPGR